MLPGCDALITAEGARELSGNPAIVLLDADTAERLRALAREEILGPAAVTALAAAEAEVHCVWGLPNSGLLTQVFVIELASAHETALIAALDDSDFVRGEEGEAVTYAIAGAPGLSQQYVWYAFWGDTWVIGLGSAPEPVFGRAALAALIAANPGHVVPSQP